jgi:hypothetical protein
MASRPATEDDSADEVPLQDRRPFGAGLSRRHRVAFVAAGSAPESPPPADGAVATTPSTSARRTVADLYADILLAGKEDRAGGTFSATGTQAPPSDDSDGAATPAAAATAAAAAAETCPICHLPLAETAAPTRATTATQRRPSSADAAAAEPGEETAAAAAAAAGGGPYPRDAHAASLAHQVCLAHSHPPSHLDRTRMGLLHLRARGWDPDARQGLGPEGRGIAYPVKAVAKGDRLGVGMASPGRGRGRGRGGGRAVTGSSSDAEDDDGRARRRNGVGGQGRSTRQEGGHKAGEARKLDAKKVRKAAAEDKKKADKLRQEMFGRVDLQRYLGGGPEGEGSSGLAGIVPRKPMKSKHGI